MAKLTSQQSGEPLIAEALTSVSRRLSAWIGAVSLRQVLIALVFLWLFTMGVASGSANYYRTMPAPPSFRHVDSMDLKRVLFDYLDANQAGPDTILVLGDCVAFGHGVITPFPGMLQFPGYRVINVSMQSFRYDLMLVVIDEAMKRGVRNVFVQLHPFEDYVAEAAFWKRLKAQRLGVAVTEVPSASDLPASELLSDAEQNWRIMALAGKEGTERFYDYGEHFPTASLSALLRYHVLSAWPLYRSRFAFDDWSGLQLSYYSSRTHRTDSYVATLPESQQRDIFKSEAEFFAKFTIADRQQYVREMANYSAAARIAAVLQSARANAIFMMAPTFVDKIDANTSLRKADLVFAADTMREIVEKRGFKFVDYLTDPELDAEMVHFDNLTATGQRLLAGKLSRDLTAMGFPPPQQASR